MLRGLDESHAKWSPMFLTYICLIPVSYRDYKTNFNVPCSSSSQATKMAQDSCGLLKTSGVGGRVFGWGEHVSLRQQLVRAQPSVSQRGQHPPAGVSLGLVETAMFCLFADLESQVLGQGLELLLISSTGDSKVN